MSDALKIMAFVVAYNVALLCHDITKAQGVQIVPALFEGAAVATMWVLLRSKKETV